MAPHRFILGLLGLAGMQWVLLTDLKAFLRDEIKVKKIKHLTSLQGILLAETTPVANGALTKRTMGETVADGGSTASNEEVVEDVQVEEPKVAEDATEEVASLRGSAADVDPTENNKPYLVFHIGPPKTATTTLQTDLYKYREILEKDNYHYAGRYYDPFFNGKKIIINRSSSNLTDAATAMFRYCEEPHTAACMDDFLKELEPFKEKGQNVLTSDESYSTNFGEEEFKIIDQVLSKDWNVVMVLGYRRFFEWLYSNHFQVNRMNRHSTWKEEWPHHEGSKGREPELIFPNQVKNWRSYGDYNKFTPYFLEYTKGTSLDLKILNIHDAEKGSVRTNFLCNMVPSAATACKASEDEDAKEDETKMNDSMKTIHVNYDLVVTAAAAAGMIASDKHSRWDMRYALGDYAEEHELGPFDFDMICPSEEEFNAFFEESLELEKEVFKDEHTDAQVEEHKEAFAYRRSINEYCRPNMDLVLKDERWTPFFKQYES